MQVGCSRHLGEVGRQVGDLGGGRWEVEGVYGRWGLGNDPVPANETRVVLVFQLAAVQRVVLDGTHIRPHRN